MKLKRRFFACSILIICLSLIVQNTLAYFTAESTARNVITSGAIDITLSEGMIPGQADNTDNIAPGDKISRIVTVTNHDLPAYVRVKCDVTVYDAGGNSLDSSDMILLNIDTQNWTYRDGWWHYNHLLDSDETTVPLFTQILFSENAGNEYKNCTAAIHVKAQATQAANNGTDVFSAAGWPEP